MTKYGVIFSGTKLTTKSGKEYYSGRTEDAREGEFNLMAFINISKAGKEYLSIMKVESKKPDPKKDKASEASDEEYWNEVLK